ncbi:general secretion pathway protein GspB [Lacimicrobium sp. SS2-24]|uniref:general secretion pathway protein GspB n=1 Tax=Lacimicrobium sp. SS2-24 TaxID=2005569 RepID=UPI000B4BEAAC|nr:general secretion pathway protein GspB [Lacimicrobium sp. SS2-24]
MDKRLPIDALKAGMVIVQVTAQNGPVRIRKSGLVSSAAMVQGLKEMGVLEVEIDPAQTVELETDPPPGSSASPTKALLMQDSSRNQVDSQLSDQFHRSLFLPSVQSLPDSWRYYSRKVALALLVFVGGLGLGWNMAHYAVWLELFTPSQASAPSHMTAMQPQAVTPGTTDQQLSPATVNQGQQTPVEQDTVRGSDHQSESDSTPENGADLSGEGEVVRAEDLSPAAADISAELLDKFRDAVSSLENTDVKASQPQTPPPQEVIRVDQLPAWVLAELPSLSFSAHMYASNPEDRWVRVNGQELKEGQWLNEHLRIVGIESQHVILAYKGQEFSMGALTDW